MSLLKSRAAELGITPELFAHSDVHVHVPAGATPKDGPSAGVALFVSLLSLMTGRAVPPTVAMTGEISLRGLVLPVGGIREKVVAAARAGIDSVLLPARNRREEDDIPPTARERLHFVWARNGRRRDCGDHRPTVTRNGPRRRWSHKEHGCRSHLVRGPRAIRKPLSSFRTYQASQLDR